MKETLAQLCLRIDRTPRIRKIALASFPLPGKTDSMDVMDGERKRGAETGIVFMGFDLDLIGFD